MNVPFIHDGYYKVYFYYADVLQSDQMHKQIIK